MRYWCDCRMMDGILSQLAAATVNSSTRPSQVASPCPAARATTFRGGHGDQFNVRQVGNEEIPHHHRARRTELLRVCSRFAGMCFDWGNARRSATQHPRSNRFAFGRHARGRAVHSAAFSSSVRRSGIERRERAAVRRQACRCADGSHARDLWARLALVLAGATVTGGAVVLKVFAAPGTSP